jgi:hypothetical protein
MNNASTATAVTGIAGGPPVIGRGSLWTTGIVLSITLCLFEVPLPVFTPDVSLVVSAGGLP